MQAAAQCDASHEARSGPKLYTEIERERLVGETAGTQILCLAPCSYYSGELFPDVNVFVTANMSA
jgi:hypothetical protein